MKKDEIQSKLEQIAKTWNAYNIVPVRKDYAIMQFKYGTNKALQVVQTKYKSQYMKRVLKNTKY